jgi:AraC-like DNA-binding protein
MELFEQTSVQSILFFALYGVTGAMPLIAALYLLLRPCNVFSASIKPPVRLRRWTAAFFAFSALAHVWWLLFYIYSRDFDSAVYALIILTDCVLLLTTIAGTMLSMLQDRRRPVWPVFVAMLPFVALGGVLMVHPSGLLQRIVEAYILLLCLLFAVYIVFAIRRYGRWLNDNYADLEHKRVWLSQVVAFFCMLVLVLYVVADNMVLIYCLHIFDLVLVFLLVWRVETLPDLQEQQPLPQPLPTPLPHWEGQGEESVVEESANPINIDVDQIEQQLKEHCVSTQLYLQHDLTLQQLAQSVGTNRSYLSQYFSRQGITYNIYINNLRVNHFIDLCQKASAAGQPIVAQQLASESGFRSYSTFGRAFMLRTGQSVTAWMRSTGGVIL